jgi:di-N-acetylchitobiase
MEYASGAIRAPRLIGTYGRGAQPHHAAPLRLRINPLFACVGTLSLVVGGAALGSLGTGGAVAATTADPGGSGANNGANVSIMNGMAKAFASAPSTAELPAAIAAPAPAPPSLEGAPALRPHEIFGFAPYWTLPNSSGFDLAGVTTLAYFSVGVGGDATVQQSGPGWVGYQSQALADLVTRAHGAGDRVVLTASCFGQSALDKLAADPTAGARLGASLVALVAAKNLDGVNIDFEGKGSKDQAGLDTLVAAVSSAMHSANPHWQVTMDTYASSAGDPTGFYDIPGLAPSLDGFFVMAYDMNNKKTPSATAPLIGAGFTDVEAVQQYTAVVAPSKVILGVPYYGYDWPTAGPGLGDPAGPATPLDYAQISAIGGHIYWDPTTQTPWTSYQVGTQWHQTFFDNPTSLALKAQWANANHIAGLGIWAMGMEGSAPAMQAALQGGAPPVKGLPPGPVGSALTTTTTTVPPTYAYSGTWNGGAVTLTVVDPASVAGAPAGPASAPLTGFVTNDPARSCLEAEPSLSVIALSGSPGVYVVSATPPTDCATGTWEFTVALSPPGATSTTTTTTSTPSDPGPTTTTSTTSTTSPGG